MEVFRFYGLADRMGEKLCLYALLKFLSPQMFIEHWLQLGNKNIINTEFWRTAYHHYKHKHPDYTLGLKILAGIEKVNLGGYLYQCTNSSTCRDYNVHLMLHLDENRNYSTRSIAQLIDLKCYTSAIFSLKNFSSLGGHPQEIIHRLFYNTMKPVTLETILFLVPLPKPSSVVKYALNIPHILNYVLPRKQTVYGMLLMELAYHPICLRYANEDKVFMGYIDKDDNTYLHYAAKTPELYYALLARMPVLRYARNERGVLVSDLVKA